MLPLKPEALRGNYETAYPRLISKESVRVRYKKHMSVLIKKTAKCDHVIL